MWFACCSCCGGRVVGWQAFAAELAVGDDVGARSASRRPLASQSDGARRGGGGSVWGRRGELEELSVPSDPERMVFSDLSDRSMMSAR
ncbi:hypothetical protein F5X68DRAFT_201904 [Plectosphaerella plurivora]|uniref:Uncharacterized protein n=1 Tax=Plectosphaerella plurivora TaxID=936078 RepID=A0A9P8VFE2_9PEZI|nr:hypothetical protein F5X68DRAFT_201904 [Plectosphaerella plurivora]